MIEAINHPGFLLIEGTCLDAARAWFRQHYPSHQAVSLLINTPYAAIADAGPFLLETLPGSPMQRDWWQGGSPLDQGVWLSSRLSPVKLFVSLQRRLKVHGAQDREYWLRLGDAGALLRAWESQAPWPAGFWHGVDSVWLRHRGAPLCAWKNTTPEQDAAPANIGFAAQIVLPQALLCALSGESEEKANV
ncbi:MULTISPECIES: DUF4123 domain-containing protein [unclassified Pseudomonas]|uniref:DUF4123 domain-containing protein n=1 Tax=unclassified Pseudomonas TaxID=196821 RepID=UPI00128DC09A|nr:MULTISPECIES: DUF4123 domain-containing protein [unclassified Pseudomonas]MPQ68919.1 DUF4123 domain-containing protein [Pseudomonas sp. MWU12-2323]